MREATKNLTSFTNKWKRFPAKLDDIYKASSYLDLPALRELPSTLSMTTSRKLEGIKKFEPKYPEPAQEKTSVKISFAALKTEVNRLAKYFFDDTNVKASAVGEEAFKEALRNAKGKK